MTTTSTGAWLARAFALLLLALIALAVGMKLIVEPSDDGPEHPDAWDERVLPLVEKVEELRGLEFVEPVHVDFLEVEEFKADVRADDEDLTDEDRDDLERSVELFRALGLITGDLDLFDALQELSSGGTAAYYTTEQERIRIRGTELTPAITLTLVHELTHALQDQHFDLDAKLDSYEDDDPAASLFQAVVEGDANRVATAWAAQLSAEEQQELQDDQRAQVEQSRKDLADVPPILVTLMSAPYALGEPLTTVVAAEGNDVLDALFEDPPTTEEVLVDPFVHGTEAAERRDVPEAEAPEGADVFESSEFGALGLYLVLAERLDVEDALAAADGWGGDHYVVHRDGDTTCMDATFTGDTDRDTVEIAEALAAWVEGSPAFAETAREGDVVHLHTCDPGSGSDAGSDASQDALTLLATRAAMGAMMVTQAGADPTQARCVGSGVVEEFDLEELSATEVDDLGDFQARLMQVMAGCRQTNERSRP